MGQDFGVNRFLAVAILAAGLGTAAAAEPPVRVGLYQNLPKVGWSGSGQPAGIFVDLIEAIAQEEGWSLEYVKGTWAEGLDRLAKGEIDLMLDVAYTDERAARYAFHLEPVLSDWFQIYARRRSGIRSLLDLNGKRVAVLARSLQQNIFQKMVEGFNLATPLVPYADYAAAFAAVETETVDAVIANRFYGVAHLRRRILEDTGIVFSPNRAFFAAPLLADRARLGAIDLHLAAMKQDPSSVYYRSLRRWMSGELGFILPDWVKDAARVAGSILLLVGLWVVALKYQIYLRTRDLLRQNKEKAVLLSQVQQSEAHFRSFVEHANDIIFSLSPEGVFTYVSPNWRDLLGHDPREVLGKSIADFIHPEDLTACLAAMEQARQKGGANKVEYRVWHQDGRWRWHMTSGSFLPAAEGRPAQYFGIGRDISARKRFENELRDTKERLEATINALPDLMFKTDREGRIQEFHSSFLNQTYVPPHSFLGKNVADILPAEAARVIRAALDEAAVRGYSHGAVYSLPVLGEKAWYELSVSTMGRPGNPSADFIVLVRDITDRKR
ncbi:MAG TPA: hypothetical protein DCM68_04830, partial [Verrucomicrobia bacterium]|nr:hypothetical protein [Verrucomicrobiota bacterium]